MQPRRANDVRLESSRDPGVGWLDRGSAVLSSVRRLDSDYHHCLDRVIYPVSNCVVTDDFNLPRAQAVVLIGKVAGRERIVRERTNKAHNHPPLLTSRGNNLQEVQVKINCIRLHLANASFLKFTLKLVGRKPMGWLPVRQPPRDIALVGCVVRVAEMKQIGDYLVLFGSRQGSQLLFDFLNTHRPQPKASENAGQARQFAERPRSPMSAGRNVKVLNQRSMNPNDFNSHIGALIRCIVWFDIDAQRRSVILTKQTSKQWKAPVRSRSDALLVNHPDTKPSK